jgi:hypothetical protein
MPTKLIINCETGEQTEVELTADEIAQREADSIVYAERKAEEDALEAAKEAAKASAINKLKALGLTADEAKALIV